MSATELSQRDKRVQRNKLELAFNRDDYWFIEATFNNSNFDVNQSYDNGDTPLHLTVRFGCSESVTEYLAFLLARQELEIDKKNGDGLTAFALAISLRKIETARYIIENSDANVDAIVDSLNRTALHHAILYRRQEDAEFLIEQGANKYAFDKENNLPRDMRKNIPWVQTLLADDNAVINLTEVRGSSQALPQPTATSTHVGSPPTSTPVPLPVVVEAGSDAGEDDSLVADGVSPPTTTSTM